MYTHLVISGHGGLINNEYQILQKGSKQYHFTSGELKGTSIYEGHENRKIADAITTLANWQPDLKVVWMNLDSTKDYLLQEREDWVKNYVKNNQNEKCIYWEIHNNASATTTSGAGGKGTGFESFTTTNKNTSDFVCKIFREEAEKIRPNCRNRGGKERDFRIIRNLDNLLPCVLLEFFFFDNVNDVKVNITDKGVENNALILFNAMRRVNNEITY